MYNQFHDIHLQCSTAELVHAQIFNSSYTFCALTTGTDVLNLVSFTGTTATYSFNIGICILLCVIYRIIAYICLKHVCEQYKQSKHIQNNDTDTKYSFKQHITNIMDYFTAKQIIHN